MAARGEARDVGVIFRIERGVMRILTTLAVLAAGAASLWGLYNALHHFDDTLPATGAALLADAPANGHDVVTTGSIAGNGEPAPLIMTRDGDRLRIAGSVDDLSALERFRETAREFFPTAALESGLREDPDRDPDLIAAGRAALIGLSRLSEGEARIADRTVRIEGDALYAQTDETIRNALQAELPSGWELILAVETPALPEPPDVAACQAALSGFLAESQITFEVAATTLDAGSRARMDDLAEILINCGAVPVEIGGHTDSDGPESANQRISQARAETVRDALVDRGVDPAYLTAVGYGESEPVAPNDTSENKALNRRIELVVIP